MSQPLCSTGLRWLWLVVVVLIIDLGSKYLILQNFALGDTVSLFPSLNLHYARNYGAAFSFLADSGGWQRWFFAGIAIGICVILMVMMYRSKATQKLNNIAYALIIGGALGNLFDRLWHGFVVDMIDFYVGDWHFATFNLADTAICIGAAFSFLADSGGWQRWFFAGIAIGICVILAVMMYRSKATQKLNNIAYALIIGGALGNLFDRLWHGFVVDMIDFYVGDWHFATFNLADTAICIGAALIVLEGFLPSKEKKAA